MGKDWRATHEYDDHVTMGPVLGRDSGLFCNVDVLWFT